MHQLHNPWRGKGLLPQAQHPLNAADGVAALLAHCPAHGQTPLSESPELARIAGIERLWIKDERDRMGLGSFKALGAAHVIARDAAALAPEEWASALAGRTYVTASAGNHGLSVAAGARVFGAKAIIYLAQTVPSDFGKRLEAMGAEVVFEGSEYEASMEAAARRAANEGLALLSDSSWEGYLEPPLRVMEGYLQLAAESVAQMAPDVPTHIILQAGVGGLAAAVAAHARLAWGDVPEIIVVEPAAAPALIESIRAGALIDTEGPVSTMGRLDCKTPSLIALAGLSRDADRFVALSDNACAEGIATLARHGFETSPSGGAALAALFQELNLGADARVFGILSEGPVDD